MPSEFEQAVLFFLAEDIRQTLICPHPPEAQFRSRDLFTLADIVVCADCNATLAEFSKGRTT